MDTKGENCRTQENARARARTHARRIAKTEACLGTAESFVVVKDDSGKEIYRAPLKDEQDMICQLALEAELRNMGIGELVGKLVITILEKNLFTRCSTRKTPIRAHKP